MKHVTIKQITVILIIAILCPLANALTVSSAKLLEDDDLWSEFHQRQNLRFVMDQALLSPFSNLSNLHPPSPIKDNLRMQIINKSQEAFPNLDFKSELLVQIKKHPDLQVQDFLYSYFMSTLATKNKKNELALVDLIFSEQKQCLFFSNQKVRSINLNSFKEIGLLSYQVLGHTLIGRGFCFEVLSDIFKNSNQDNWNPRKKQIIDLTLNSLANRDLFIRFYNKPGVVGTYTPTDNNISISTPSQFDLETLVHETAHANFNVFFHELFTFIQKNKFNMPPEFLSEPNEEIVNVANLERSPFLNLLNEFQAWQYEALIETASENKKNLVNIILSYYGRGMKKEVHEEFLKNWGQLTNPEDIPKRIMEKIIAYNKFKKAPAVKGVLIEKSISKNENPTQVSYLKIQDIIESLADVNSNATGNFETLEHYFDLANIRHTPREKITEPKALALLSELDHHLSEFLLTGKTIYQTNVLTYYLNNRVLPIELPKTFALLAGALQSSEDSLSAKLLRVLFFPNAYNARTTIEWPLSLLATTQPTTVDTQHHEVIANFIRIGSGIFLTPFLENGANELFEVEDCSLLNSPSFQIPLNKKTSYEVSMDYIKYFLKNTKGNTLKAIKYAIKSEPLFHCRVTY